MSTQSINGRQYRVRVELRSVGNGRSDTLDRDHDPDCDQLRSVGNGELDRFRRPGRIAEDVLNSEAALAFWNGGEPTSNE